MCGGGAAAAPAVASITAAALHRSITAITSANSDGLPHRRATTDTAPWHGTARIRPSVQRRQARAELGAQAVRGQAGAADAANWKEVF